jgi:hypothetical protein
LSRYTAVTAVIGREGWGRGRGIRAVHLHASSQNLQKKTTLLLFLCCNKLVQKLIKKSATGGSNACRTVVWEPEQNPLKQMSKKHTYKMVEKRNAYRLLVAKPDGKRPLGRPRCRWVDNIRMDLGEVG